MCMEHFTDGTWRRRGLGPESRARGPGPEHCLGQALLCTLGSCTHACTGRRVKCNPAHAALSAAGPAHSERSGHPGCQETARWRVSAHQLFSNEIPPLPVQLGPGRAPTVGEGCTRLSTDVTGGRQRASQKSGRTPKR